MPKLTKSFIDGISLPTKKPNGQAAQEIYRDSTLLGFGLLAGSGGTKSFFVERRVSGRVKRISIGRYGHLTPAQARERAQQILGEIALGQDPSTRKKSQAAHQITLSTAFEDYLRTRKNLKPRTVSNYRDVLVNCLGDWQNRRLVEISKDMVEAKHAAIGKNAPARANNAMRVLRAVYNHARNKYESAEGIPLINHNPVDRLSQNRAWYSVERRRSVLRPSEIQCWYAATEGLNIEVTRDYLKFLLFTGLRKMEAASLKWSDVNLDDRLLTITDTKNRQPHTLPLSNYLYDLLTMRRSLVDNAPWVFPSPRVDGHLSEPRSAVRQVATRSGKDFCLHDLRRTFITVAESLDIPAYALKRLINHHDSNDVTAGYIVADIDRLRDPMEKISEQLISFAEGSS